MKNIAIVGFMGSGKTVVARALAKELGMRYVGVDSLVEKKENKKISDIFSENTEEYFRKIESQVIEEVSKEEGVVIDAGGGAVIKEENIKNFKATGVIICLSASIDVILARTGKHSHRPLLKVDNPKKRIEELLSSRAKYYAKADYTIDTSDLSVLQIVEKIKAIIR